MRSWEICGLEGGTAEEGADEELFCRGAMGLAFEIAAKASTAFKSLMCILRLYVDFRAGGFKGGFEFVRYVFDNAPMTKLLIKSWLPLMPR